MKERLIIGVILVCVITGWTFGFFSLVSSSYESTLYTWRGSDNFSTIEEAIKYQELVISEAQKVNAKVETTISVESPPTLYFSVMSPELKSFPYGEVINKENPWRYNQLKFWILLVLGNILCIVVAWKTDFKQE